MTLAATRPRMFINGEWTTQPTARRRRSSTRRPRGDRRGPKGTAEDADRAVEAAAAAFEEWSLTTPQERSQLLFKFADAIEATPRAVADRAGNVGKPKGTADFDVEFSIDNLRFFAGAARVIEGKAAAEYLEHPHEHDPPRAGRRGGPGGAVELPADDGHLEVRARRSRPAARSCSSRRR
jgi:acyl-CoA reductase-like NAD-dependent aldehyde dehydrogenase